MRSQRFAKSFSYLFEVFKLRAALRRFKKRGKHATQNVDVFVEGFKLRAALFVFADLGKIIQWLPGALKSAANMLRKTFDYLFEVFKLRASLFVVAKLGVKYSVVTREPTWLRGA